MAAGVRRARTPCLNSPEHPTIGEVSVGLRNRLSSISASPIIISAARPSQIDGLVQKFCQCPSVQAAQRTMKASDMKIAGKQYRSIWPVGVDAVGVIDQTKLPHEFVTVTLAFGVDDAARAIKTMQVRGAPLIGATAAYGIALAMREDASDETLDTVHDMLLETRPTAVNLRWALKRIRDAVRNRPRAERAALAWREAAAIADEDVEPCARPSASTASNHPARCRREEKWRAPQHPHPLQCGLARLRRLGHRARADLYGA